MSVKDRVAIVTAADNEIGKSIGRRLASERAKVVLCGENQGELEQLSSYIQKSGGACLIFRSDFTNNEQVQSLMNHVVDEFGQIDILVNNTEMHKKGPIESYTEHDWDEMLNANLKSYFLTCRAVTPFMKKQQYGRIVNISSRSWLGENGEACFSASKGGVISLTRTLALELAKYQITSNAVCPGIMQDQISSEVPENEKKRLINMQPTRKFGKPDHISYAVMYFASDHSSYVTGQTLFTCGGNSLYSSLSV